MSARALQQNLCASFCKVESKCGQPKLVAHFHRQRMPCRGDATVQTQECTHVSEQLLAVEWWGTAKAGQQPLQHPSIPGSVCIYHKTHSHTLNPYRQREVLVLQSDPCSSCLLTFDPVASRRNATGGGAEPEPAPTHTHTKSAHLLN